MKNKIPRVGVIVRRHSKAGRKVNSASKMDEEKNSNKAFVDPEKQRKFVEKLLTLTD